MKLKHYLAAAGLAATILLALLATKIKFTFDPASDGIFILEGENGYWLEVSDDLVPEDASRLIWAMPRYPFRTTVESSKCTDSSVPCLDFSWDKKLGRGFIRNTWPDGSKLIINLGRFRDTNGGYPSGLFIGGGLPPADPDYLHLNNDATGMTWFDGRRWYHVWCNANEGILLPSTPFISGYPSDWQFLGSWVRENDGRHLTLESRHRLLLHGVPLQMNRHLFYTAGNSYIILIVELENHGASPVTLQYLYGDEPWIGDYGSSAGDVGWAGKELFLMEHEFDTRKQTYFGMFDYGNELAGEHHSYTGVANFIEWKRDERPAGAYISNFSGGVLNPEKPVPLVSERNRFIGLKYGPVTMKPGDSYHFAIAVGMAGHDPQTGFPVKPETELNR